LGDDVAACDRRQDGDQYEREGETHDRIISV
jgi:hypothetical protein